MKLFSYMLLLFFFFVGVTAYPDDNINFASVETSGRIFSDTLQPRTGFGTIDLQGNAKTLSAFSDHSSGLDFYNVELTPGHSFTGSLYYWATGTNGSALSASLVENPPVDWLEISPAQFTDYADGIATKVDFIFTAPVTPGIYTTVINDQNGNWSDMTLTLTVTTSPAQFLYTFNEQIYVNEPYEYIYKCKSPAYFYWDDDNQYYYFNSMTVNHFEYIPQPWFNIQPDDFTLMPTDSTLVTFSAQIGMPDNDTIRVVRNMQHYSYPSYWQFNFQVVVNPFIIVSPLNQSVPYTAGSTVYSVTANTDWVIVDDAEWLTVLPVFGSGNAVLTASYLQNTTNTQRTANVYIAGPEVPAPVVFTVTQAAAPSQSNWVPEPNLQYSMSVVGKIQLSGGGFSLNENDLVGAFVGSECRGVASPVAGMNGLLFLSIGSDQISGEQITFKIFLAAENQIYDANQTLVFQSYSEVGTLDNPYIFTYGGTSCTLSVLPSFHHFPSPGSSFSFAVSATDGCDWTAESDQIWCVLSPTTGIGSGTFTVTCSANTSSATRTSTITIASPGVPSITIDITQAGIIGPPNWIPLINPRYNMSVIGKIEIAQGIYSLDSADVVGAFAGPECRGVASPIPSLGGVLFLSVGSNTESGEAITFKIYLHNTDEIVDANEIVAFQNSGELGTMTDPFIISYLIQNNISVYGINILDGQNRCFNAYQTITVAGNGTSFTVQPGGVARFIAGEKIRLLPGVKVAPGGYLSGTITTTGMYCYSYSYSPIGTAGEQENITLTGGADNWVRIYPNPSEGRFLVEFSNTVPDEWTTVRILNMNGRVVFTRRSQNTEILEVSLQDQSPGIYLICVNRDGWIKTLKMIVL
ncbi:MAG TPA: BACON domain-containing carbohydrate-binding protein [Bacteroidales bacterium]|nr:BACON domain-containing carbohydrate-binding protein [Bacteroidales bacterium]HPS51617.1 BACON domain-containing carbohydrate-binding protein [Bacteroidales bacterium]